MCNALRGEHEHLDHLRAASRDVSGDVTADMTVEQLADAWIDEILIENRVKPQTFASRTGTFVQPDNMRRSLRSALQGQADLKWVSPHVLRKTVATVLSGQGLVAEAAAQLGHADESITKSSTSRNPRPPPTSATP